MVSLILSFYYHFCIPTKCVPILIVSSPVSNILLHYEYEANMRNVTNDQANIVTGLNINIVTAERRTNMLSRRIADI